jgi:nitroimidazol reductase NimA-like FMN-containing flavoprotein (pyridoxamine 5'-phosphate oxidase superfamily)
MAVLATVSENKPHCSLMAYLCNDMCTEIYMVTYRDTQKYKNLVRNPSVSMLIDTRVNVVPDRKNIKALTINGQYKPLKDPKKEAAVRQRMLERHPHLRNILQHEDGQILVIKIISFLFLNGPTDAHFETVP